MKIFKILIFLFIPSLFAGCSYCSDDKAEREANLLKELDEEMKELSADNKAPEDIQKTIETKCNSNFEGRVIHKGDYEFTCINGKWYLKD